MEPPNIFTQQVTIRFEHCDPAGIVFYPRYFEMVNRIMEEWLEQEIGVSIADLIFKRKLIIPTLRIECEFLNPSRLEDVLTISLKVEKLGNSSFTLNVTATCGEEVRFQARPVVVVVDKDRGKSVPIPGDMRTAMEKYLASQQ
ncbi:MAG: thioesterase family protein [Anaerolineae bacterium]|nr:thioesterase family protein [Anaerolineae bacterium]